jgi:hypothetical protein
MEAQIFYWTGVVVWWGVCLMVIASVVACVVLGPLYAFHRAKNVMWEWKWAAEIGHTGFTKRDITYATRITSNGSPLPDGCKIKDVLAWVEMVKKRGDTVRKM